MLNGFIAVILSILVVFIAPAYAQNQTQIQQTEWVTYDDPILGISIQHPKGWEIEQRPSILEFSYGERPGYNDVILTVGKDFSNYEDSEELMKETVNLVRGDIEKINSIDNNAMVAGIPASKVEITYLVDPNIEEYRYAMSYYINDKANQIGYFLTLKSIDDKYSTYLPIFEKMVSSFKIH